MSNVAEVPTRSPRRHRGACAVARLSRTWRRAPREPVRGHRARPHRFLDPRARPLPLRHRRRLAAHRHAARPHRLDQAPLPRSSSTPFRSPKSTCRSSPTAASFPPTTTPSTTAGARSPAWASPSGSWPGSAASRMRAPGALVFGGLLWNIGLGAGIISILLGRRAAASKCSRCRVYSHAIMFVGFGLIGLWGVGPLPLSARQRHASSPSGICSARSSGSRGSSPPRMSCSPCRRSTASCSRSSAPGTRRISRAGGSPPSASPRPTSSSRRSSTARSIRITSPRSASGPSPSSAASPAWCG